jgi:hypothetical protein
MEQVSVERWLEQQNTNSDIEQYAEDTWYVHLPSFPSASSSSSSFFSVSFHHPSWVLAFGLALGLALAKPRRRPLGLIQG